MYYAKSGGGEKMLGVILSCLDKFSESIRLDLLYLPTKNPDTTSVWDAKTLTSLLVCSSSDKLKNTEVSHDFSIIVTIGGVARKAINKNNKMRAIGFITSKV
jgi:hypothetical protein